MTDDVADDEDDVATVTYCTYGQCADRTVPCESCTTIYVNSTETTQHLETRVETECKVVRR